MNTETLKAMSDEQINDYMLSHPNLERGLTRLMADVEAAEPEEQDAERWDGM